ncbi:hypothetical protein ACFYXM_26555 [Streptomyces sp. NPDC002476]
MTTVAGPALRAVSLDLLPVGGLFLGLALLPVGVRCPGAERGAGAAEAD